MDIPNKPHMIVIDHHQRKCYHCNKELPHFTILHSLPIPRSQNKELK